MARQDFAHNSAPSKTQASSGVASVLPVVAIIFVAATCFAAGYWLGTGDAQQTGNKTDVDVVKAQLAVKSAAVKVQIARIERLEALVEQWKNKAGEGAHSKVGELQFYKSLPKQSVMPAPFSTTYERKTLSKMAVVPKHAASKAVGSKSTESASVVSNRSLDGHPYRVQIASFRSQHDASPLQQKIKRAGFPAFIRSVDLGDKGIWFRVYAGPFVSKSVAEKKRMQIEMQIRIKGLLVRGR